MTPTGWLGPWIDIGSSTLKFGAIVTGSSMSADLAFWEVVIAGLGVAFGLGGLARLRTKPERGPGDGASSWGLIVTGSILVIHGASVLLGQGT